VLRKVLSRVTSICATVGVGSDPMINTVSHTAAGPGPGGAGLVIGQLLARRWTVISGGRGNGRVG